MSIKEKILKPAYVTYAKFLESNKNRHLREMYRQGVARGEALRKKKCHQGAFYLASTAQVENRNAIPRHA